MGSVVTGENRVNSKTIDNSNSNSKNKRGELLSEQEAFMTRVEAVTKFRGLGRSLRPTGLERRVMRGSTQTA